MANSLALTRLQEEHRQFRKDHPHGFFARPFDEDGKRNYFKWFCGIPGKKGVRLLYLGYIVKLNEYMVCA